MRSIAEIRKMLARDDIKKNIEGMARWRLRHAEQFTTFIDTEIKKFAGIINREGLKMDVN